MIATHLKLRSGDAQRTDTLGTAGARRIAIATWFRHSRDMASRWLSDGVFFGGAELRNNEARLSLTGLRSKMGEDTVLLCYFDVYEVLPYVGSMTVNSDVRR